MEINISKEMAEAVTNALIADLQTGGIREYGNPDDYTVSNQEALEFFQEVLKQI